jgi:eukaryotic-like serine/threonine-protein kinase
MKRCFKCGQEYGETPRFCPKDGQRLFPALLAGRYRLEEKIGEGSMGVVVRAIDERFGQRRAVKFLRPEYAADETARAQFLREAAVAARIKHPHIAPTLDYGIDEVSDCAYFTTELIEGASLREIMRRRFQSGGVFAPEEMARVLSQTAKVVEAAHAAGVVHADLKPENVFIQGEAENWFVKVSDFGVAKLKGARRTPATVGGASAVGVQSEGLYLSPEQSAGAPPDARSDIYSLGAILYEMAVGERPSPTLPPSARLFGPPKSVEAVILQAIETDPRLRHRSASDFAHEFEDAVRRSRLSLTRNPASNPSFAPVRLGNVSDPRTQRDRTSKWMIRMAAVGGLLLATSAALSFLPSVSAPETPAERQPETPATDRRLTVAAALEPPKPPAGMAYVSGGAFVMGNDASTERSEKPEHEVLVASFFIDETEVTNAQYAEFLKAVKRPAPSDWKNGAPPPGKENHPVTNVSWEDAKAYAEWAGKRLPTEAEWEYAARGADKRLYPWGDAFQPEFANTRERGAKSPLPVGSIPQDKSPFGVTDMAGNVAEWTATEFAPYPGSQANPDPGKLIVRGGSFGDPKEFAMTAARAGEPPQTTSANIGFRCAKNIPER